MQHVLKFNRKEGENRTPHLIQTKYYSRLLLYTLMSQARMIYNHNLPRFGMVSAGSCHVRFIMSTSLNHSTSAGIVSSYCTLVRKLTLLN